MFGKSMNSTIPSAIAKQLGRLISSALVWQLVWKKENSEFKLAVLRLNLTLFASCGGVNVSLTLEKMQVPLQFAYDNFAGFAFVINVIFNPVNFKYNEYINGNLIKIHLFFP